MIELLIGIFAGALLSWFITHVYHKKSSNEPPEWAKPFIAKLPDEPPTKEKLLELFQNALDTGKVTIDYDIGCVACPQCNAPSSDFKKSGYGDDNHGVLFVECPHCGWVESRDV